MSILVFVELQNGNLKKSAFEAAAYAADLAASRSTEAVAIALGESNGDLEQLGKVGISKVWHVADAKLNHLTSRSYTKCIIAGVEQTGADTVVLSHTSTGKTLAPRVAIRMNAGLLACVSDLPDAEGNYRKSMFSGKAWGNIGNKEGAAVITVNPNAYTYVVKEGAAAVEALAVLLGDNDFDYTVKEVINESAGMTPLPEAELVVSAGRGMKGPENWGIIEELAGELGATTACSRPVSDIGWRPHHEHVGQTGITIKPNLYIAVGISGAIQHLAGVNQSKCIVVINKDPEAPFFKAADYGIVGDAFDVVPRLTEAIKKMKAS